MLIILSIQSVFLEFAQIPGHCVYLGVGRNNTMKELLHNRIAKAITPNLQISPNTTPVVFFGDYFNARSCTISINPSDREFFDSKRSVLSGFQKRLCSRVELRKNDYDVLDDLDCEKVLSDCIDYFKRNPYKQWFNKYEKFLEVFDFSYYKGSAVHLDLVQWATTPFWKGLTELNRQKLLKDDLPFLKSLLEKNFDIIFLNGNTVVGEVSKCLNIKLNIISIENFRNHRMSVYFGKYNESNVVGWSSYLQSANVGGYESISELASLVKSLRQKNLSDA